MKDFLRRKMLQLRQVKLSRKEMATDKKLLFLDKFFKKQKLKDIPICEIAEIIRSNLHARGVLVMIDHDYGGNQMGCSGGLTREGALELFKYWADHLIKELKSK